MSIRRNPRPEPDALPSAQDLARRAALAEHGAVEQRERGRVAELATKLDASQSRLVAAARVADHALGALYDAASEHDLLVAEGATELRASGLPAEGLADGVEVGFATGGGRTGLRLAGRGWSRLDARAMLNRCLYGAVRSRLGEQAAAPLRFANGVGHLERFASALLADAPLPRPIVPPTPEWKLSLGAAQADGRPLVAAVADPAADRVAQQEAEAGRRRYAATRARLVSEHGEAFVAGLEGQ